MLRRLLKPNFSRREREIIKECCRQVFESMNTEEVKNSLDPAIKEIKEDIKIIMQKLEPTI
jgi:DNA-binding transcriptional regulator GbsR (MarR family)